MAERKDRIRIQVENRTFSVVGGSFQEMLAAVKQINGRRFEGALKVWQLPGRVEEIRRQLQISGLKLEGGAAVTEQPPVEQAPAGRSGDRIRVVVQGKMLAVVGGSFQEMLAVVKSLPGRRFEAEAKVWEIPGEVGVIKGMIQAAGFELEGSEQIRLDTVPPMEALDFVSEVAPPPPFEPPDFLEEADFGDDPRDWWEDEAPAEFEAGYALPQEPPFEDPVPAFEKPEFERRERGEVRPARGGDQIRVRVGGTPLVVSGGSFQAMLGVIKSIPGRRFNAEEKVWEIPEDIELESVQQTVKAAGFVLKNPLDPS